MGYSPPPSSDLTHYLNLTDAVELGFGAYQTLRRYIAQGKLPAVKVGGRIKVLRSDLNALAVPKRQPTFEEVETAWKFLHDDGARSLPPGFTLVKGPLCDRAATVLGTGICNLEAKSASLYWHVAVQVRRAPGTEITHGEYREELAFWLRHLGLLVKDPAPK
mgnify:CR=1 FL=1